MAFFPLTPESSNPPNGTSMELVGMQLDSGALIPIWNVDISVAEIDAVTNAISHHTLYGYQPTAFEDLPHPWRKQFQKILVETCENGRNLPAALAGKTGRHYALKGGVIDRYTYFDVSSGAMTTGSVGVSGEQTVEDYSGTLKGSIGGYPYAARWAANFRTRYSPVWTTEDVVQPGTTGTLIPQPLVMHNEGYLHRVNLGMNFNAIGVQDFHYDKVGLNVFGTRKVWPGYDTVHIGWVDYDVEPIPDDEGDGMPRFNPRTATTTVGVYYLSKDMVASFVRDLWTNNLIENISKAFIGDGSNAILGLQWFYGINVGGVSLPIAPQTAKITVGNVTYDHIASAASSDFTSYDCGKINVPRHYGDHRDYTASVYRAYIPFVGWIDLDPRDVVDKTLHLKYYINLTDGSCVANITNSAADGHDAPELVFQTTGQWGYDIPLRVTNTKDPFTAALRSLPIPFVSAAANTMDNSTYSAGSLTANANVMAGFVPRLSVYRREDLTKDLESSLGRPAAQAVTVGEASGFLKAAVVRNAGSLATRRATEIVELLQEGIWL